MSEENSALVHPTLEECREGVRNGELICGFHNEYIVFKYSQETVHKGKWNSLTEACRGICFDLQTGQLQHMPFTKFFNLDETSDSRSRYREAKNIEFLEKLDGSMGAMSVDRNGDLFVTTPGSPGSSQALWASAFMNRHPRKDLIKESILRDYNCIIGEIIFDDPDGHVIKYDSSQYGLTVTAVRRKDGSWLNYSEMQTLCLALELPCCRIYSFSDLEEILQNLSVITDIEGYVAHWPDTGFRLKMKGEDFKIRQRAKNHLSPNLIDRALSHASTYADWQTLLDAFVLGHRDNYELFEPYFHAAWDLMSMSKSRSFSVMGNAKMANALKLQGKEAYDFVCQNTDNVGLIPLTMHALRNEREGTVTDQKRLEHACMRACWPKVRATYFPRE